jgi:hypothetical protein
MFLRNAPVGHLGHGVTGRKAVVRFREHSDTCVAASVHVLLMRVQPGAQGIMSYSRMPAAVLQEGHRVMGVGPGGPSLHHAAFLSNTAADISWPRQLRTAPSVDKRRSRDGRRPVTLLVHV